MFQKILKIETCGEIHIPRWGGIVEPTLAQKKRARFGTMFTLHQLLNRAGVKHENADTLICSGYMKTRDRF